MQRTQEPHRIHGRVVEGRQVLCLDVQVRLVAVAGVADEPDHLTGACSPTATRMLPRCTWRSAT